MNVLDMNDLTSGRPLGLTPFEGGRMMECAVVSFERAGHTSLPVLPVHGKTNTSFRLVGPQASDQMRKTHGDPKVATEYGACGIAIMIAEVTEGLAVLERSPADGGGFDYYMYPVNELPNPDKENFFADATHLMEVSGLLRKSSEDVERRVKEKIERLKKSTHWLPGFVIVVEFSTPVSRMEWL